jgi:fumarate reductase subunit C
MCISKELCAIYPTNITSQLWKNQQFYKELNSLEEKTVFCISKKVCLEEIYVVLNLSNEEMFSSCNDHEFLIEDNYVGLSEII